GLRHQDLDAVVVAGGLSRTLDLRDAGGRGLAAQHHVLDVLQAGEARARSVDGTAAGSTAAVGSNAPAGSRAAPQSTPPPPPPPPRRRRGGGLKRRPRPRGPQGARCTTARPAFGCACPPPLPRNPGGSASYYLSAALAATRLVDYRRRAFLERWPRGRRRRFAK